MTVMLVSVLGMGYHCPDCDAGFYFRYRVCVS